MHWLTKNAHQEVRSVFFRTFQLSTSLILRNSHGMQIHVTFLYSFNTTVFLCLHFACTITNNLVESLN